MGKCNFPTFHNRAHPRSVKCGNAEMLGSISEWESVWVVRTSDIASAHFIIVLAVSAVCTFVVVVCYLYLYLLLWLNLVLRFLSFALSHKDN